MAPFRTNREEQMKEGRAFPSPQVNERAKRMEMNQQCEEWRQPLGDTIRPLAGCPTTRIANGWVTRQEGPGGGWLGVLLI